MSTTSRIRRGVATVGASALTFGVISVAAPAAFADTTPNATAITVTPSTQNGTANTDCLVYQVTATANGAPAVGTIDVVLHDTEAAPDGSESFCIAGAATSTGTAFATGAGTAPNIGATFTTDANGQFSFGVSDTEAETVNILAFDDENADHTNDPSEAQTSSASPPTAVFAAANANTGNNSVHSLTVTPSNVNARPGDTAVYLLTATTGGNSPQNVNGATINYIITSGPDATNVPQPCQTTVPAANQTGAGNNNPYNNGAPATNAGQLYCLVPTHAGGTDQITFYVNQTTVTTPTTGPDNGEPTATATLTDLGAAPAGDTINVFCVTNSAGNNGADPAPPANPVAGTQLKACHDFTTDANGNPPVGGANDNFVAIVTDPSANTNVIQGGSGNGNAQAANTPKGVTVNWTQSGASATAALIPTTDTCDPSTNPGATGGTDTCNTTLNEPAASSGEVVTVTGTIAGTTPAVSSSATKTFQSRPLAARNITLKPSSQNGASGTGRTVTAKVTDVNGAGVPNVQVTFSTTGSGHFTSNSIFGTNQQYTTLTGQDGTVQAQVATNGGETGTETISATISANHSQRGDQAGFVNGTPDPTAQAGNCSATATVKWSKQGSSGTPKTRIVATIHCFSPKKHVLKCRVHETPEQSGLKVRFKRRIHGDVRWLGVDFTNNNGVAKFTKKHLKRGKLWRVFAHVYATGTTKGTNTALDRTRIK